MGLITKFVGVVWFLAGLIMTIRLWSWFTVFSDIITDDFFNAVYWVGLLGLVIVVVFVVPFSLVTSKGE